MSDYKTWLGRQDKEFIDEVCKGNKIPDKFKDYGHAPINLEQLKELDKKYINLEGEK